MKLSTADAAALVLALLALRKGDPRRFDDMVWLAFGDRCGELHEWLARVGAITPSESVMDVRITDRGIRLISELEAGRTARRAQPAGASRADAKLAG